MPDQKIAPKSFMAMLRDHDSAKTARAMQAMMGMKKLDAAALEKAYAG